MNKKTIFALSLLIFWGVSFGDGYAETPASREKTDPAVVRTKIQGTDRVPRRRPPAAATRTKAEYSFKAAAGRLMTLNFVNVDIQEALSALAMQREINIVTTPTVSGQI